MGRIKSGVKKSDRLLGGETEARRAHQKKNKGVRIEQQPYSRYGSKPSGVSSQPARRITLSCNSPQSGNSPFESKP